MLENLVQKLNKSLSSIKSNSPEKTPPKQNMLPEKPNPVCKACKGAGCCILCDKPDDWEDMLWCTNKAIGKHVIHYSCDNLTYEMQRSIKNYYCPKCRMDGKFQVTYYKKVSKAKITEIDEILMLKNHSNVNFNDEIQSPYEASSPNNQKESGNGNEMSVVARNNSKSSRSKSASTSDMGHKLSVDANINKSSRSKSLSASISACENTAAQPPINNVELLASPPDGTILDSRISVDRESTPLSVNTENAVKSPTTTKPESLPSPGQSSLGSISASDISTMTSSSTDGFTDTFREAFPGQVCPSE